MTHGNAAMVQGSDDTEWVRGILRTVQYPGFTRDIVAAGFVKDIVIEGAHVTVQFAPNTRNDEKIERMEADISAALIQSGRFDDVDIRRQQPFADAGVLSRGGETPNSDDLAKTIALPDADDGNGAMRRPDMAPQAGYDEDGPVALGGPRSDAYEGELPVFQWEIDPQNANAKSGTANLTIGQWDFRVWWQVHPARLVYASIQAMREDWVDHEGAARSHPVGRSEAVNLAYDLDRKAVVAVYGTVRDFRPFVDAFYRGYVLKN